MELIPGSVWCMLRQKCVRDGTPRRGRVEVSLSLSQVCMCVCVSWWLRSLVALYLPHCLGREDGRGTGNSRRSVQLEPQQRLRDPVGVLPSLRRWGRAAGSPRLTAGAPESGGVSGFGSGLQRLLSCFFGRGGSVGTPVGAAVKV